MTFKQWLARRRTWTGAVGQVVAYTEADPLRVLWATPTGLRRRLLLLQPGSPQFDQVPRLLEALDEVEQGWERSRKRSRKP